MNNSNKPAFVAESDKQTGQIRSVQLYGHELLDAQQPCESELWVNGHPLALRPHSDPNQPDVPPHLKGERFTNHLSGWGLVLARSFGGRPNLKHPCFGITSLIRRELCDLTVPIPGPGGPVVEAPLWVDTLSLLNWNWQFWGDDTRMIFPSSHSNGSSDEWGHCGYENDTPEIARSFLKNIWRRTYPGCMIIHGGLFYNARTENWIALTCRRPQVGYALGIENAGRGVSYDFTLHAPFALGESLQMPEIKLYYGPDRDSMMSWMGDYVTKYYEEPPEWVFKTVFGYGLNWDNQPTWTQQADFWEEKLEEGEYSGVGYSLVTNRPIHSGTTPLGYEPDPNYGSPEEFRTMCRRLAERDVPILIWMSHSGVLPGGDGVDDDWFIRGIDGRTSASWGNIDSGSLTHINPGHPGYIEYTKKWIRFYIEECGCKGIFFDCLSWVFPPDYTPRPWMRYPGDTNLQAVKFMREAYACIKECDPEAIMLGEGSSLEGPVNVFSIHANPQRAQDGLGPRDFFLMLNQYAPKRLTIDQGPRLFPASGFCSRAEDEKFAEHNKYLTRLLREEGGRDAFTALPDDLSLRGDLLFVPVTDEPKEVRLPPCHEATTVLREEITGVRVERNAQGVFAPLSTGIYRMKKGEQT